MSENITKSVSKTINTPIKKMQFSSSMTSSPILISPGVDDDDDNKESGGLVSDFPSRLNDDSLHVAFGSESSVHGSNTVLGVENRYNLMKNILNQLKMIGKTVVVRRDNSRTNADTGLLGSLYLRVTDPTDTTTKNFASFASVLDLGLVWCHLFTILFTNVPLQFWSREVVDMLEATLIDCAHFSTVEVTEEFQSVWYAMHHCIYEFTQARDRLEQRAGELYELKQGAGGAGGGVHSSNKRHKASSAR